MYLWWQDVGAVGHLFQGPEDACLLSCLPVGVRLLKDALHEHAGQGPGLTDWEIALFFGARIFHPVGHCFDNDSTDNDNICHRLSAWDVHCSWSIIPFNPHSNPVGNLALPLEMREL